MFVDDDPIWQELAKLPPEKLERGLDKYIGRLPVAVRFDVSDGLRLTMFLAALRAYVDQTTPDMARWETLKYKDQPYVKISPTERAKGRHSAPDFSAIYYSASGDALLVAFGENVLKHAIDRELARAAAAKKGQPAADTKNQKPASPPARPWLGSNLALEVDRKILDTAAGVMGERPAERQRAMQVVAWSNLPILNEWMRRYPDQDPVAVHERVWKIRLLDPAGGSYVWNDTWQTMESTVYGHPGEPKTGPDVPPALIDFAHASFGLTFENQGLRARASLERKPTVEKRAARPRNWEVNFQKGSTLDDYARQLDFFGIEIGIVQPGGKIDYAFHLAKPKPDTRSITEAHKNEHALLAAMDAGRPGAGRSRVGRESGARSQQRVAAEVRSPRNRNQALHPGANAGRPRAA